MNIQKDLLKMHIKMFKPKQETRKHKVNMEKEEMASVVIIMDSCVYTVQYVIVDDLATLSIFVTLKQ